MIMHQYLFQVQPRYALNLLKGIERVMKVLTMQIIFRCYVTFLDMMVNYYLELCTKPIACLHILLGLHSSMHQPVKVLYFVFCWQQHESLHQPQFGHCSKFEASQYDFFYKPRLNEMV